MPEPTTDATIRKVASWSESDAPQPVARMALPTAAPASPAPRPGYDRKGISSSATMFMSLSIGLIAGPAVSL